jgi:hypothetical protein
MRSLIIATVAALALASVVPAFAYQTGGSGHSRPGSSTRSPIAAMPGAGAATHRPTN